jgi:hypothetical protein
MTEQTILAPIELTDDELLAVSGGRASTSVAVGISQRVHQSASLAQVGGDLSIGGGNGATSVSGNTTFSETFSATISQSATNTNNGSVTATVSASSSG